MDFSVKCENGRLWGYNKRTGQYDVMVMDAVYDVFVVQEIELLGVDPNENSNIVKGASFDSFGAFKTHKGIERNYGASKFDLVTFEKLISKQTGSHLNELTQIHTSYQDFIKKVMYSFVLYLCLFYGCGFLLKFIEISFGLEVFKLHVYIFAPVSFLLIVGMSRMTNSVLDKLQK